MKKNTINKVIPPLLIVSMIIIVFFTVFRESVFNRSIPYEVMSYSEAPKELKDEISKFGGIQPGSIGGREIGNKVYYVIVPNDDEVVEILGFEITGLLKGSDVKYRIRKLQDTGSKSEAKIIGYEHSERLLPMGFIRVD